MLVLQVCNAHECPAPWHPVLLAESVHLLHSHHIAHKSWAVFTVSREADLCSALQVTQPHSSYRQQMKLSGLLLLLPLPLPLAAELWALQRGWHNAQSQSSCKPVLAMVRSKRGDRMT